MHPLSFSSSKHAQESPPLMFQHARLTALGLLLACLPVFSQNRPPATPLITHDPYFSIWSNTDKLTDSPTRHWTGHPQPLSSLVRIDGKTFRIMGTDPRSVPPLPQTSMQVSFTHTRYTFSSGSVEITLTFFTPAFLDDMDILSRPVTYLTWTAHSTDNAEHQVSVLLDASPDIATSMDHQPVTFSRHRTATSEVLSVGTRDQAVLNRSGDDLRIDWGYFNIAIPDSEGSKSTLSVRPTEAFARDGILDAVDTIEGPMATDRFTPHMAVALPFGSVGSQPVSRHLLVSYTEGYAIQLMHQNLRPWWQRNNMPVADMLDQAEREYTALEARGVRFDADLTADLTKTAGRALRVALHARVSPVYCRAQAGCGWRRQADALCQREFLKRRHGYR